MAVGQWLSYHVYIADNVDNYVAHKPGNYCLLTDEGIFCVGKSDTDLNRRLKEHLSPYETNDCIKYKIKYKICFFQFIYASMQEERDQIESYEIRRYNPVCNIQQP